MKPGIVFSSFTSTRSPSTKKSTRARPSQPAYSNVCTASCLTRARAVGEIRAGIFSSIAPGVYFAA